MVQGLYCGNKGLHSCSGLRVDHLFTSEEIRQCHSLAERWWDTTHTFNIADREMTMTPHDFHRMIGLRCDRALINLKGKSGTRLGIDLLGRRQTTNVIRYFNIEMDYKLLSQVTADDYTQMAKAILLYLLGAYIFANEGQKISLK